MLEPLARSGRPGARASSTCSTRSASARCRSRRAPRPSRAARSSHTIRDVGAVSHALVATEPGEVVGVRGPFGTTWPLEEAGGGDLVIVAGGIGLAPLRPADLPRARAPRRLRVGLRARRRAHAGRPALRARARGLARSLRRRRRRHGRQRRRGLARPRRRRHAADPARARSTPRTPSPSSAARS